MPGTKRKIPIQKRETKEQRAVAFSKRRQGLFKKAADLCLISDDAQVAVLATPPSDKTNVFYSFGHSSVDDVVDAFLCGRRPNPAVGNTSRSIRSDPTVKQGDCLQHKKPRIGFWWEETSFANSEDPKELLRYIERLKKLKEKVTNRLKNKDTQTVSLCSNSSALTVEETKKIGGSQQNLWRTKNDALGNDDFGNGLCHADVELPGASLRDIEDDFADILDDWTRENNITIEQSSSYEHFGLSTFSELLDYNGDP